MNNGQRPIVISGRVRILRAGFGILPKQSFYDRNVRSARRLAGVRDAHPTQILLATLLCLTSAFASTEIPAPPQSKPIALKGATIHPVTGPDIANGTIVFDKGKIVSLGSDANIPAGAEVIDVTGKHIYPGLISADTVLGLTEISAVRSTVDFAETGTINPNARAITSVNPDSELIPVTRANGILTALVAPEGGILSGQSAVIRMDGWTPDEMTVRAP
ncbi:MAG: hypothetical protein M3128_06705, partial [Verrucomicrobiota bacterium]|nr:hypothetical protein [Verrucomicrobiota bacterium]